MRFRLTEPSYIGATFVDASASQPAIVTLPDAELSNRGNTKPRFSLAWDPMDSTAQAAQVTHAAAKGVTFAQKPITTAGTGPRATTFGV